MTAVKTTLKLFVANMPELKETYTLAIETHNNKINNDFPDAGFDLLVPHHYNIFPGQVCKIDHEVKCAMFCDGKPCSYYLYPRSSISKTPLRLANSVGIIDSGYRGNIIAVFDHLFGPNFTDEYYSISACQRLVQICSPTLSPIYVELVDNESDLLATERGEGGFGSTGL